MQLRPAKSRMSSVAAGQHVCHRTRSPFPALLHSRINVGVDAMIALCNRARYQKLLDNFRRAFRAPSLLMTWYGQAMEDEATRAEQRRRAWLGGLVSNQEASELRGSNATGETVAQKLEILRIMAEHAWLMEGHGTSPRLQRHLGGIRRSER